MTKERKDEFKKSLNAVLPLWILFIFTGAAFRYLMLYGYVDALLNQIWKYQVIAIVTLPPLIVLLLYWAIERRDEIRSLIVEHRAKLSVIGAALLGSYIAGGWIDLCLTDRGPAPLTVIKIILTLIASFSVVFFETKRAFLGEEEKKAKKDPQPSLFLGDTTDTDEFGIENDAIEFAKLVKDGGGSESLIFGIDSPWGSGKTTYLKFCKKIWEAPGANSLVFEFSTLPHGDGELVATFLHGLERFLVEKKYPRDLRVAFKRYTKFISGAKWGWLDLSALFDGKVSNKEIFDAVKKQLEIYGKKLIIIIDDLDRASPDQIKNLLDTIRVGAELPYVSFVLCFDAMNILSFEDPSRKATQHDPDDLKIKGIEYDFADRAKTIEYLEKMVNVKQTLVFHPERLKEFFKKHLLADFEMLDDRKITAVPLFSKKSRDELFLALDRIFDPSIYHHLVSQIGDPRKIKRLVNVFRLRFGRIDIDVSQIDISAYDLLLLMMIYLNHPGIFKKIYDTEIEGKEYFSLRYNHGLLSDNKDKKTFVNSPEYKEYIRTLDACQRVLLQELFSEDRADGGDGSQKKISADAAAFNGTISAGRNLEGYLKLITRRQLPHAPNETKFYDYRTRILSGGASITEIVAGDDFIFKNTENVERRFKLLIEAIIRSIELFKREQILAIIDWMLDSIQNFSVVDSDEIGIGLREDITLQVPYLLDRRGWSDKDDRYYENSDENVAKIADTLLDAGGVFDKVLAVEKTVIRFHDALKLRLHLSPFRGGSFHNIYRGLIERAGKLPGSVDIDDDNFLQMLEPTIKIFEEFSKTYIDTGENFFTDVYALTAQELLGKSEPYIRQAELMDKIDLNSRRYAIASFVVYQLANNRIDQLNFGCGLYSDPKNPGAKIQQRIRSYLFDVAFNIKKDERSAEYFIDYLLMHYDRTPSAMNSRFQLDIKEIISILGKRELGIFWIENGLAIKEALAGKEKTINTGNYKVTYDVLPDVYNELEKITIEVLEHEEQVEGLVQILQTHIDNKTDGKQS